MSQFCGVLMVIPEVVEGINDLFLLFFTCIPLCKWTMVYLKFYSLKNFWVASGLGVSQIRQL